MGAIVLGEALAVRGAGWRQHIGTSEENALMVADVNAGDGTIRVDRAALPPAAQKLLDPKGPLPLRQMAARGIAPGLKPHEALAVIVLLAESPDGGDGAITSSASATLAKLPAQLLAGALTPSLDAGVCDVLAHRYATDAVLMERLLTLPQLADASVVAAASRASEAVSELIAVNEERLLRHPPIIERLYMNRETRMSTADRVLELAVRNRIELPGIPAYAEAAAAIMTELIAEPSPEPTYDDILFKETEALASELEAAASDDPEKLETHVVDEETGEEKVKEAWVSIEQKFAAMTVSQKIRKAMLGTVTDRAFLVRDRNRLVAVAAVRSPMIQENEVARFASSRNVNDDVLRVIAANREWMGKHTIKLALVGNPRTPFAVVARLIPHLLDHELKALAKNKNVPGNVSTAARQHLMRKSK